MSETPLKRRRRGREDFDPSLLSGQNFVLIKMKVKGLITMKEGKKLLNKLKKLNPIKMNLIGSQEVALTDILHKDGVVVLIKHFINVYIKT